MSRRSCPKEAVVLTFARTSEWPQSLRDHVSRCSTCRDVAQTSLWLQTLADTECAKQALPDGDALWQKARMHEALIDKQTRFEEEGRLAGWIEAALILSASLGLIFWAVWCWQEADSLLAWLSADAWVRMYGAAISAPIARLSTAGFVVLLLVALVFPILISD